MQPNQIQQTMSPQEITRCKQYITTLLSS
jgi:hypothetical protein